MEPRRGHWCPLDISFKSQFAGIQRCHLVFDSCSGNALLDGLDDLADVPVGLVEVSNQPMPVLITLGSQSIEFTVILFDEFFHKVGVHQFLTQTVEHFGFQFIPPDGQLVRAGSFVGGRGAGVCVGAVLLKPLPQIPHLISPESK